VAVDPQVHIGLLNLSGMSARLTFRGEASSRPLSGVGAGLLAFANLDGAPIGIHQIKHEQLHMRRAAIVNMVLRTTVRQLKLQSVRLLTVRITARSSERARCLLDV
jgi:hypothetical protein